MSKTITFSPEATHAYDLMQGGTASLFLTGKAGTGKSTLIRHFLETTKKNVAVLAPTGVAALNIEGQTIHSFFGFSTTVTEKEVRQNAKNYADIDLLHTIDTFLIDEISMVRADMFDYIDLYLRTALKSKAPFADKQMILVGDLYQLPPVVGKEEKKYFGPGGHYETPYFFSSLVMQHPGFDLQLIELEHIYRQSDHVFIDILQAVRTKHLTAEHLDSLNSRVSSDWSLTNGKIYLTTKNDKVDEINAQRLAEIPGKTFVANAEISSGYKTNNYPTDKILRLKPGAQVMFVANDTEQKRWVNGTLGEIKNIDTKKNQLSVSLEGGNTVTVKPHTWKVKKYIHNGGNLDREAVGSFTQFPIRLARACTIHKSQGKTFDEVIIDLSQGTFAHGQAYVALSRCRSLEGIVFTHHVFPRHVLLDYHIISFMTKYQYQKATDISSLEAKIALISEAIDQKKSLEIVYLKANDVKSKRIIRPSFVGPAIYAGKPYTAVEGYCTLRKEDRIFNVAKILEIRLVEK